MKALFTIILALVVLVYGSYSWAQPSMQPPAMQIQAQAAAILASMEFGTEAGLEGNSCYAFIQGLSEIYDDFEERYGDNEDETLDLIYIEKFINEYKILHEFAAEHNSAFSACNAYNNLLITTYQREEEAQKQRLALYEWQLLASNVMLWLVVAIVLTSLAFTGYQLHRASFANIEPKTHEARISAKEIRITSSSVGIILFTLSLIFLYMFIQEVYTIDDPSTKPTQQVQDEE